MRICSLYRIALAAISVIFFNKRIPFVVGWAITNRCNLRCDYCGADKKDGQELDTDSIVRIINELHHLGTKYIFFTGGEPLLRDDIETIIGHCKKKSIRAMLNTNGLLVKDKIAVIKKVDTVTLSLDGPKEIHNRIRGLDSYDSVIEAASLIRNENIPLCFSAVLSKYNLGCIDFLIGTAKKFGTTIRFQPASLCLLFSDEKNPLAPEQHEFQQAMRYIMMLKKGREYKTIRNSLVVLEHFCRVLWHQKINNCASGRISCRIQSDGKMSRCNRNLEDGTDVVSVGVKKAFFSLSNSPCAGYCCANRLELNYLLHLNPDAVINVIYQALFCK